MSLLRQTALAVALAISVIGAGCNPADEGAESGSADQALAMSSEAALSAKTVRAYYASAYAADQIGALAPLFDDRVVVEAPSILILKGKNEIGKKEFLGLAAGVKEYLAGARVREVISHGDNLVVARIDLPLPNGDLLTQVEFFEVHGGKITHLQSYYDGLRFTKALPAIAIDKLKRALGV